MKKRFTSMLLAVIMVFSLASTTVLAVGIDTPQNDTERFYLLKEVKEIGTKKNLIKYYTDTWQKASSYTVTNGSIRSFTISLSVQAKSGSFPVSSVSEAVAGLGFDISLTRTFSVATVIPADCTRNSKLGVFKKVTTYKGDLYCRTIYGPNNVSDRFVGKGEFTVPEDLYLEVVYQ